MYIIKETPKECPQVHKEYIKSANSAIKKKKGLTKNSTPQQAPIQSTKSTIEKEPKTINNLDQAHKLQRKASLIPLSESSLLPNALLFLSFLTIHKRHKGATTKPFPFPTHKRPMPTWKQLSH